MAKLKKEEIIKFLEIKPPLLMIDEVRNVDKGFSGIGIKKIKLDDWFFECHFENKPVLPAVLQTEAMLQTVVSIYCHNYNIKAKECLINKINTNFYFPVTSIGQLHILAKIKNKNKIGMDAEASINFQGKKICEGKFRFVNPSKLVQI